MTLVGGVPALVLLVPDVVAHAQRAAEPRYLMPTWVCIEAVLAFYLASLIRRASRTPRIIGIVATTLVLLLGAWSSFDGARRTWWWIDSSDRRMLTVARTIERTRSDETIITDDPRLPMVLSTYLSATRRFRVIERSAVMTAFPLGTVLFVGLSSSLPPAQSGRRITALSDPSGTTDDVSISPPSSGGQREAALKQLQEIRVWKISSRT